MNILRSITAFNNFVPTLTRSPTHSIDSLQTLTVAPHRTHLQTLHVTPPRPSPYHIFTVTKHEAGLPAGYHLHVGDFL